jgi:hypothetical protein
VTEFTTYSDGRLETSLAFALWLTDAFTGLAPLGRLQLKLDGKRVEVPRNRSSYWLFLNLPLSSLDGSAAGYRLEVESDYYFPLLRADIRPRELDRRSPVVVADLVPTPAYPFAPGNTLLRGMVQDLGARPIAGAIVEVMQTTVQGTTTAAGEFALYFRRVAPDDVALVDGRRLLMVQSSTDLSVSARHPDFLSGTVTLQVEEGRENRTAGPIQLGPI